MAKLSRVELAPLGKLLIGLGAALVVVGVAFVAAAHAGFPRLPGDFAFRVGNVQIFLPIASSVLVSIVLTLLLRWLSGGR